jgi:hypothetical protein
MIPCHLLSLILLWLGLAGLGLPRSSAAVLQLTEPQNFQVLQRSRSDQGTLRISGRLTAPASAECVMEARLVGAPVDAEWRKVATLTAGQTGFGAELTVPAGGWFRLEVRVQCAGQAVGEAVVAHVGVGEVFVVAGQSNSANHGEEKQRSRTGSVAAFSGSGWQLAHDPQPGASGGGGSFMPPFADALVEKFNVPVGIVAVGAGGTSVREWLPRGSRFANPPTVEANVLRLPSGEWASQGILFENFVARLRPLGSHGFRAVLWHQGESDANQRDPVRTLPGERYQAFLTQLIDATRREVGWEFPWFVAQASYHTPDDPGSPEIRAAQAALWQSGVALPGPDTDALTGDSRDGGGQGVHFSGKGLREHAQLWVKKIAPWLEAQLESAQPRVTGPTPPLVLPGMELFKVGGRPAFVFLPPPEKRAKPQPWIFYAPTLPGYPDGAERWMHERFLAAGIAVAGVDVGETYGSGTSHTVFEALYRELQDQRCFATRPCLLGRSRGGLVVSSWAMAAPKRVAGLAGIYPVFDFRTFPGLTNAAPAYGLSPAELDRRAEDFNPAQRIELLAKARIPALLIHGDVDEVVPLRENSGAFVERYREAGAESLVQLIVLPGQGHNYFEGFFQSQELVDFVIERARAGTEE